MSQLPITLPTPPNPEGMSQSAWNRAFYAWALKVKGNLENNSVANSQPAAQGIVLGNYTTVTQFDDTLTGTALANAVCTLVNALQLAGIVTSSTR